MRAPGLALLCALLSLVSSGCASVQAQRAQAQQRDALLETARYVYPRPPAQVWPAVEAYFRERGFALDVQHGDKPEVMALRTDFKEATLGEGFSARVRYYAQVQPDLRGGTHLRVFRHTVLGPQVWAVVPTSQQLVSEEEGAGEDAEPATPPPPHPLDPSDKRFEQNFFRDLSVEQALRARLQGGPAALALTGGLPSAGPIAAQAAVALGSSLPPVPVPEDVRETRCGPAIPGLDEGFDRALAPGGFLVLGEVHGTQEVPRFVGQAVCHAAHLGAPVVLALELPVREQRALDRYLQSDGDEEDVEALTAGPFWHRPEQDGRSSRALVELIERARTLGRQGLRVAVLSFDVEGLQGSAHDAAMAQRLLAARKQQPRASFIVLTGNVHASNERGVPWDRDFVPMGWHLSRAGVPFHSYDVLYRHGSAWDCRLGPRAALACGAHPTQGGTRTSSEGGVVHTVKLDAGQDSRPGVHEDGERQVLTSAAGPGVRLQERYQRALQRYGPERFFVLPMAPDRYPRGFDGYFYVGQVHAAPPAAGKVAATAAP
ncbi:ChaN family lipoprotein [Aggregicoccus sp. 17bor-14]|uniref:hypothetical protein n=1 Tax=Myxococcaceae TaxID=31 RepID=UPI00129C3973|nr:MULTISPECIES: hypothetical protein [Myxococcaceae]MBF5042464.1 hypothetical protein [Simulacricoccus sp. 17bor-14]MRI88235.1 ChaN family lipoprotein [Aggregicoccus sp. 17bor-14]